MPRNRIHQTTEGPKTKKAAALLQIAEIPKETLRKIKKASQRQGRLDFEARFPAKVHGDPDKKSQKRASRRQGKQSARRWGEQY
jgi:hypothetical protein